MIPIAYLELNILLSIVHLLGEPPNIIYKQGRSTAHVSTNTSVRTSPPPSPPLNPSDIPHWRASSPFTSLHGLNKHRLGGITLDNGDPHPPHPFITAPPGWGVLSLEKSTNCGPAAVERWLLRPATAKKRGLSLYHIVG